MQPLTTQNNNNQPTSSVCGVASQPTSLSHSSNIHSNKTNNQPNKQNKNRAKHSSKAITNCKSYPNQTQRDGKELHRKIGRKTLKIKSKTFTHTHTLGVTHMSNNNSQEKNSKLANWLETRINSKKKNEVARLSYKWNYNNSTTEKEEEYVANEAPEPDNPPYPYSSK